MAKAWEIDLSCQCRISFGKARTQKLSIGYASIEKIQCKAGKISRTSWLLNHFTIGVESYFIEKPKQYYDP